MIDGTAPSPVMTPRDITITVTTAAASGSPFDYGIKYKPFKMTVREPYQWTRINPLPQCSPYSNPNHPTVVGWTCDICYTTLDQNGNELPNKIIPFNENFTSAAMPVYPGETWTQPSQCGPCSSGHAQNLCDDLVKASNHPQTYVPPIVAFGSGDGSAEVDYWSGDWRVGSSTEPEGVGVQENIWVRYQDHGDHAQATSPPSRLLPP